MIYFHFIKLMEFHLLNHLVFQFYKSFVYDFKLILDIYFNSNLNYYLKKKHSFDISNQIPKKYNK